MLLGYPPPAPEKKKFDSMLRKVNGVAGIFVHLLVSVDAHWMFLEVLHGFTLW